MKDFLFVNVPFFSAVGLDEGYVVFFFVEDDVLVFEEGASEDEVCACSKES